MQNLFSLVLTLFGAQMMTLFGKLLAIVSTYVSY